MLTFHKTRKGERRYSCAVASASFEPVIADPTTYPANNPIINEAKTKTITLVES